MEDTSMFLLSLITLNPISNLSSLLILTKPLIMNLGVLPISKSTVLLLNPCKLFLWILLTKYLFTDNIKKGGFYQEWKTTNWPQTVDKLLFWEVSMLQEKVQLQSRNTKLNQDWIKFRLTSIFSQSTLGIMKNSLLQETELQKKFTKTTLL